MSLGNVTLKYLQKKHIAIDGDYVKYSAIVKKEGHDGPLSLHRPIREIPTSITWPIGFEHETPETGKKTAKDFKMKAHVKLLTTGG